MWPLFRSNSLKETCLGSLKIFSAASRNRNSSICLSVFFLQYVRTCIHRPTPIRRQPPGWTWNIVNHGAIPSFFPFGEKIRAENYSLYRFLFAEKRTSRIDTKTWQSSALKGDHCRARKACKLLLAHQCHARLTIF